MILQYISDCITNKIPTIQIAGINIYIYSFLIGRRLTIFKCLFSYSYFVSSVLFLMANKSSCLLIAADCVRPTILA